MNFDNVMEIVYSIGVAIAVGFARIITVGKEFKLSWVLGQLFISGVAGWLMVMLAHSVFNLQGEMVGLAAGVAGYSGSSFLDTLYKWQMNKMGLIPEEPKEKDKEQTEENKNEIKQIRTNEPDTEETLEILSRDSSVD